MHKAFLSVGPYVTTQIVRPWLQPCPGSQSQLCLHLHQYSATMEDRGKPFLSLPHKQPPEVVGSIKQNMTLNMSIIAPGLQQALNKC